MWYYQYIIRIWDDYDNMEDICTGVVCASSWAEAITEISTYYSLIEVIRLKELQEGQVLDLDNLKDAIDDEVKKYIKE